MAAFCRHRHGAAAVAGETRHAEPGPGAQDGDRAAGEAGDVWPDGAQVLRPQNLRRERERSKVVHQKRSLEAELEELPLGDVPSPVGELRRSDGDRTGDGDGRGPRARLQVQRLEIAPKRMDEGRKGRGQILPVVDPIVVGRIDQCEASVCTADVAD